MTTPSEMEEIQRIAYELWQIDGEPAGRDQEHWERARRIFESRKAPLGNLVNGSAAHGRNGTRLASLDRGEGDPGIVAGTKDNPRPDHLPDERA